MKNDKVVVPFRERVVYATTCDVTPADILDERELELASMLWNNMPMDAESQIKLIKHERALEKFGKKAA